MANTVAPIANWRANVSSGFGPRRAPRTAGGRRGSSVHKGIDIRMPTGTPFKAAKDGTVVFAGRSGGYGNLAVIRHADGTYTKYGHAQSLNVRPGQQVRAGEEIGKVGSTGNSSGPHLHFEVRQGDWRTGPAIDPRPLLEGASTTGGPVKPGDTAEVAPGAKEAMNRRGGCECGGHDGPEARQPASEATPADARTAKARDRVGKGAKKSQMSLSEGAKPATAQAAASADQGTPAAATASEATNPAAKPLQRFRDNDPAAVKAVQQKLKDLGHYTGEVDGKFGPLTDQAVRAFQGQAKDAEGGALAVDGAVGPKTLAALGSPAAPAAKPADDASVPAGGAVKPGDTPDASQAKTDQATPAADDGKGFKALREKLDKLGINQGMLNELSQKHNVPVDMILGVIQQESGGNPNARSHAGARGLMQLMPGTARGLGVKNSYDPKQNVEGGVKYLGQMLRAFNGNETLALAAYNAGPGNVRKYKGIPPFSETRKYVQIIQANRQQQTAQA